MVQSPAEFVESYTGIGEKKTSARWMKTVLLAVLAGFMIGMGGAVTTVASYSVESASIAKLICGMLFPFGLYMVVLTGAELFTGNCLITIPLLERRVGFLKMLRNLALVYLGNMIGAALLAAAIVYAGGTGMAEGLVLKTVQTAAAKCALPFGRAVVLGILCNLLVCIGVMCALCGRDGASRAVGSIAPVSCFVICGFEHCVANMYYIPAGIFTLSVPEYAAVVAEHGVNTAALTWQNFFLGNLVPVTIGNVIGGCAFAALMWACHKKTAAAG